MVNKMRQSMPHIYKVKLFVNIDKVHTRQCTEELF